MKNKKKIHKNMLSFELLMMKKKKMSMIRVQTSNNDVGDVDVFLVVVIVARVDDNNNDDDDDDEYIKY